MTGADADLRRLFSGRDPEHVEQLRRWIEQRDRESRAVPGAFTTIWLPKPEAAALSMIQAAAGDRLFHLQGDSLAEVLSGLPDLETSPRHVVRAISHIPVFDTKEAYNAAVLARPGGYIMVYRVHLWRLIACELDENWAVVPGTRWDLGIDGNIDARLFKHDEAVMMSTSYHAATPPHTELWTLRSLHPVSVGPRLVFKAVHDWPGYTAQCEKNWLPFAAAGEIHYIHSICPLHVIKLNFRLPDAAARLSAIVPWNSPWPSLYGNELRGSAPPVLMDDGTWLLAFHTVDANRNYYTGLLHLEQKPLSANRN